jgi:hypothetical protein
MRMKVCSLRAPTGVLKFAGKNCLPQQLDRPLTSTLIKLDATGNACAIIDYLGYSEPRASVHGRAISLLDQLFCYPPSESNPTLDLDVAKAFFVIVYHRAHRCTALIGGAEQAGCGVYPGERSADRPRASDAA